MIALHLQLTCINLLHYVYLSLDAVKAAVKIKSCF